MVVEVDKRWLRKVYKWRRDFGVGEASISHALRAAAARKYAVRTVLRVSASRVDVKE
jgi:hypothetical protein